MAVSVKGRLQINKMGGNESEFPPRLFTARNEKRRQARKSKDEGGRRKAERTDERLSNKLSSLPPSSFILALLAPHLIILCESV